MPNRFELLAQYCRKGITHGELRHLTFVDRVSLLTVAMFIFSEVGYLKARIQ